MNNKKSDLLVLVVITSLIIEKIEEDYEWWKKFRTWERTYVPKYVDIKSISHIVFDRSEKHKSRDGDRYVIQRVKW